MAVLLEKHEPVSLKKKGKAFANFDVKLNWTMREPTGLMAVVKSLLPIPLEETPVDLDLGCFVELIDGTKFVIQPLGNQYGTLHHAPYVHHSGDDRTGLGDGETLNFNGAKWHNIKRVLVYAYIYEGAPKWSKTNGTVTISVPKHDDIVVEMGNQKSKYRTCALVEMKNNDGEIQISKKMSFHSSQVSMDQAYGYAFRWQTGRK